MFSPEYLQNLVKKSVEDLDLNHEPNELYAPIIYSMSVGGKRMRPLLTLLSCDMFGGDINRAIFPSIGIEMFHNFTLLHDDIMDKAPIRRGKETVYKKWNENIAILSGDTMFAMAYDLLLRTDKEVLFDLFKVFNRTAIEVCEGQQYDMNYETMDDVSIKDYLKMIRLKTAVLLGLCLKTGALIAKANPDDVNKVYLYGEKVGMAFQLRDDLLDVFGAEEKFGKQSGGDIITNKKTYLYIKSLEIADKDSREELMSYFSKTYDNDADNKIKVDKVKEIYLKIDVKSYAENEIKSYYNQAISLLQDISVDAQQKSILHAFTEKLMDREL